jgi:hypothetical protein
MKGVTKAMLDKVVKDLHGLQVIWENGVDRSTPVILEAVCLCTREKGLSIKPLGTPEEVHAVTKAARFSITLEEIKGPSFCLTHMPITPSMYRQLKQIADTKRRVVVGRRMGFNPVCPY